MKKLMRIFIMLALLLLPYSNVYAGTVTEYSCISGGNKSIIKSEDLLEGCSSDVMGKGTNNTDNKKTVVSVENQGSVTQLKKGSTYTLKVDWDTFNSLSKEDQETIVENIANTGVYEDITTDKGDIDGNQEAFVNKLQSNGSGTALVTLLFGNTKPNYAKALEMYSPFSGFVGTVIAVIVIVVCALLIVVIAADIAYITIPMFQFNIDSKEGESGKQFKIVSPAARKAVAAQDEKSGGAVLWMWFKDRVFLLLMLTICIMYLIDGSIFKIIGAFLDLVSGF